MNCVRLSVNHHSQQRCLSFFAPRTQTVYFNCSNHVAAAVAAACSPSTQWMSHLAVTRQVHGFPKIMGVLTHLDKFVDNKKLRTIKKRLKQRFWQEICGGAKARHVLLLLAPKSMATHATDTACMQVFYLSGIRYGRYPKMEIHNLNRFLSVMKFRPLSWRTKHPYVVVDRVRLSTARFMRCV